MLKNKKIIISLLILVIVFTGYFVFHTIQTIPLSLSTEKDSFTLIVLPDTQFYSSLYPDIFCAQTNWIVENKEKLNIMFVSQLGDITNNGGDAPKQWEVASRCMGKLDGKVPYGILPGNHDAETPSEKETGFASYTKSFPTSRFSKYSWYKGNFEDNVNNYEIIETNGEKIMFLNMGIEPSDKALEWAKNVLKQNPNIYTIFTTHKYLSDTAKTPENMRGYSKDGNTGLDIWNKLISKSCSIKMTLSGHFHTSTGENMVTSKNICNEDVYQIMQDYQNNKNGGDGELRIFTFSPKEKKISVSTYSPYTKILYEDKELVIPLVK
ncbi:MAG: metallophosphoesterase [bacterium]